MNVAALRASLLDAVAADAARARASARAGRTERLAAARRDGDALVAEARRSGERDGAAEVAHRLVRARREARAAALAAQREAYEGFRRQTVATLQARRDTPGYAALLEQLVSTARGQLGVDAELELDPPDRGGLVATLGARRVDYTLPSLVERAIAGLGTELRRLWT